MRHRRLVPLIAAASVAVLAAAGCGSTSAAVTVDDQSISRQDFEDQLDEIYDNDEFRGALFGEVDAQQLLAPGGPVGGFAQEYVAQMAFIQVQFMVLPQVLDDEGLEVTDADREAVEEQLEGTAPGLLDSLPDGMREQYLDGFAGFDKLRADLDEDEFNEVFTAAIESADVTVSSRYGTWNADEFTVDPPTAPRAAPGSTDGGDGQPLDGAELPAG